MTAGPTRSPPAPPPPPRPFQIAEISVNKQLEGVQKVTFDDMFGYDAAIKSLEDDNMELAGALWKCVRARRARWGGADRGFREALECAGLGRPRAPPHLPHHEGAAWVRAVRCSPRGGGAPRGGGVRVPSAMAPAPL